MLYDDMDTGILKKNCLEKKNYVCSVLHREGDEDEIIKGFNINTPRKSYLTFYAKNEKKKGTNTKKNANQKSGWL